MRHRGELFGRGSAWYRFDQGRAQLNSVPSLLYQLLKDDGSHIRITKEYHATCEAEMTEANPSSLRAVAADRLGCDLSDAQRRRQPLFPTEDVDGQVVRSDF